MPEHTIAENLTRLQNATTAIGNAITAKGGTVTSGDGLEDFASDIASIPSGGGVNFVTREIDFVNNTTSIIEGSIGSVSVYGNIKKCNVANNGTINAYYGDRTYTEDGNNGQVMVKIPKFYYKLDVSETGDLDGFNIRHGKWSIADAPMLGFKLHPAFIADDGVTELDYFLVGAFYSCDNDLKSVSVLSNPYVSITRASARTSVASRGTGWYLLGVKQLMAIIMLMVVEYGFNTQAAIGYGCVNSKGSASSMRNMPYEGTTGSKSQMTLYVSYRGIDDLWGNVYKWVDGINIYNRTIYICDNFNFVDDSADGYTQIAFSLPDTNFISAIGYDQYNDWVLLPSETSSNSTSSGSIGDKMFSGNNGWCIAAHGGSWTLQDLAGAFMWSFTLPSSAAYENDGSRIMYIPQTN